MIPTLKTINRIKRINIILNLIGSTSKKSLTIHYKSKKTFIMKEFVKNVGGKILKVEKLVLEQQNV